MKKTFWTVLLALIAAVCLCFGLAACDSGNGGNGGGNSGGTTEGLQFQKRKDEEGNEYAAVVGLGTVWETDIVIPSTFRGLPVKEIGASAFNFGTDGRNAYLTSIEIPDSVTMIGDSAFAGCGLTSVTISDSVTVIGDSAFSGCSNLESITVEEGNQNYSSQDGILYNKAKTEFVHIPKAVKGEVTIPDAVTFLGSSAFKGCSGLTSVTIGSGVTEIWQWAFQNCSGLASVTIPDSVTKIGQYAFQNCSGLTSVTIGSGVTEIGRCAFMGCDGLQSVLFGNPHGWRTGGGSAVSETLLQDPAEAANALCNTYVNYSWYRG